jgi:hypothetical protein
MANDISIIVSADLGDTLIKLDLAKHAINDLGNASEETAAKQDAATASTGLFTTAMTLMDGAVGGALPALDSFASVLAIGTAAAFAAAVAVVALASVFGTLVAIVADFVAPLTLVAGLLGGLGAGFIFAGVSAMKGGGALQVFADKMATLHSMFDKTGNILAHAFLPYLLQLADAAQKALLFIDKLAREPLAKAMQDMSTQGVRMLNDFVNHVTAVIARPIRLAFKIAFGVGAGSSDFANLVADWWHRFSAFLFGYSNTHPIKVGGKILQTFAPSQVDGIFQPLIDWFNRHHFTKQGQQIGHSILMGFVGSGASQRMGQFLVQVLEQAFLTVARGFINVIMRMSAAYNAWVDRMHNEVNSVFYGPFIAMWHSIEATASSVLSHILSLLHQIGAFFSQVFTLHINVPSIPSVGSIAGSVGSTLGGLIPHIGSGGAVGRSGVVVAHYHAAAGQNDLQSRAQYRQFVRQIGAELGFQQSRLAAGH